MIRRHLRIRRRQSGFTLVELLIVVSLTGVITGAITSGLFTALRASSQLSKVLPGPQAAQNLNSWLSADVESAIPSTIDTTGGASIGCSAAPESGSVQNVLHFEATDPANPVTLYAVSYRYHVTDKTLWRTFCVKNAAPSHHGFLVENLSTTSPPVATVSADKRTISLAITVLIKDQAYPFTLTSSVRTPKDPPTTLPISTSTLAAQSPCALIAGSGAAPAFNRTVHTGGKNPLTGSVTFTVNTNLNTGTGSTCSDIWIRVLCGVNDCGSAGAIYLQLTQQATPNTHQWKGTFTCPAVTPATLVTFCGGWKASNYPVEITDGYDPVNLQGSIVDGSFFMAVNT